MGLHEMLTLLPELRVDLSQESVIVLNVVEPLINGCQYVVPTGTATPVFPSAFDCVGQTLAIERAVGVFYPFAFNRPWRMLVQNVAPVLRKVWFKMALRNVAGVFRPLLLIR